MEDNNVLESNIPIDLQNEIKNQANGNEHFSEVYRVAKWGKIEERTFLSTFSEIQCGYIEDSERYAKDEIGTYSTSVYTDRKNCDKFIKLLKRGRRLRLKYPYPVIIKGKTSMGYVQKTKDRILDYNDDTHIDWWIFKDKRTVVMADFCVCE